MQKPIGLKYPRLVREALYHVTELEAGKLKGEIELDEAYFKTVALRAFYIMN